VKRCQYRKEVLGLPGPIDCWVARVTEKFVKIRDSGKPPRFCLRWDNVRCDLTMGIIQLVRHQESTEHVNSRSVFIPASINIWKCVSRHAQSLRLALLLKPLPDEHPLPCQPAASSRAVRRRSEQPRSPRLDAVAIRRSTLNCSAPRLTAKITWPLAVYMPNLVEVEWRAST
jgi:hypothetical protein